MNGSKIVTSISKSKKAPERYVSYVDQGSFAHGHPGKPGKFKEFENAWSGKT